MCAAVYRQRHLVKATETTAGLAESNGSLPGLWRDSLHVTCGLAACTLGSAPGPTLSNEYGKTLPLPYHCLTNISASFITYHKFLRIIARKRLPMALVYFQSSSACSMACFYSMSTVGHMGEPCKNGWTNRDAIWEIDLCEPRTPCDRWGSRYPNGKGQFYGSQA